MAKTFQCQSRSPLGLLIFGILLVLFGLLMVSMLCLLFGGMAAGAAPLPKNGHEAFRVLVIIGFFLAFAVVLIPGGLLCMNATLLPRTLEVTDEAIKLRWFRKPLGHVPFANVKNVIVLTRAMAGQTANRAELQALVTGGALAAVIARSRFDPNEPIGFMIRLYDAADPDTYWPTGFFGSRSKQLNVRYYWQLPHIQLVQKINQTLSSYKQNQKTADTW